MANYNKIILMGNLTRDPELRYTPNNTPVCGFAMAINRYWRNQQGERQEETTFVDCDAFGRTAELINQYTAKGRPLFIEGRLKLDQWQDREGNNRSKHKVVVENFQFIDSRGGGDQSGGGGAPAQQRSQPAGGQSSGGGTAPAQEPAEQLGEDDIPF